MQDKDVFSPSHMATFLLLSSWDLGIDGMLLFYLGCLSTSQEMLLEPHRFKLVELSPHLLLACHFFLITLSPPQKYMHARTSFVSVRAKCIKFFFCCSLQEMEIPKSIKNDSMTIYSIVNHSREVNA